MAISYIFKPEFVEEHLKDKRLDPEVMAALLARFSRTGDGMGGILKDISGLDFNDSQKMVDRILKFIDYGHASIGGLTGGVVVGTDMISMLTPYLTFFLQSKQDGQETSTRYCEYVGGVAAPSELNVPVRFRQKWDEVMLEGFNISRLVRQELNKRVVENPEIAHIPDGVKKSVADRMRRNYGFDRSRYTLPLAALTNFGMIMTGREWADTLKYLSASPIEEMHKWADEIRTPLIEIVPHPMKHSYATAMTANYMNDFFERGFEYVKKNGVNTSQLEDLVKTSIQLPPDSDKVDSLFSLEENLAKAYAGKKNRYDIARGYPEKIHVSVYWNNMAIAEARDINRQRPCHKDTLLAPVGFYMAPEMAEAIKDIGFSDDYLRLQDKRAKLMVELAKSEAPWSYSSLLFLGDQTPFEMHTDAAHMTYVLELRTGLGVHFRYDEHMRQAFSSFEKQLPQWTKYVNLGTGEPE
jgi:hypothetical protein